MAKYKVLEGKHIDYDPAGALNPDGTRHERMWGPGEEIECEKDLLTFNHPGMAPKFVRVDTDISYLPKTAQVWDISKETLEQFVSRVSGKEVPHDSPDSKPSLPQGPSNLQGLSVSELRRYAEEEEIDLRGAKSKEDILKAISAAPRASSSLVHSSL